MQVVMPESVESLPVVMGEINVRANEPQTVGAAVSAVALAGGDSRTFQGSGCT